MTDNDRDFRRAVGAATGLPPERLESLRAHGLRPHAGTPNASSPQFRLLALGMPVGDIGPDASGGRPLVKARSPEAPGGVFSMVLAWARVDWRPEAPVELASDDLPYVEGLWFRRRPGDTGPPSGGAPEEGCGFFIDVRNGHLLTSTDDWRLAREGINLLHWLRRHPGAPGLDAQQPGWVERTLDCIAYKRKYPSLTWAEVAANKGLTFDQLKGWRRRLRARGHPKA